MNAVADPILGPLAAAVAPFTEQPPETGLPDWYSLLRDGAAMFGESLPPVVEIVQGLMPEACKLVIGGGAKSFKTWITIDLALAISHGLPFLGRQTARRRVLYVNLELRPDAFTRRFQRVAKARGLTIEQGWFTHLPLRGQLAGMEPGPLVDQIVAIARARNKGLVVLDPTYKANTGEENSSRDQTKFFNELDRITTEAKCGLVLNDHFGKGNQAEKDPLDALRGSSAKGGDVDAAIILRQHEIEECFTVHVVQRELAPVAPFVIGWRFPQMELRTDLNPDDMKRNKPGGRARAHDPANLLAVIRDTTEQNPISITDWAEKAEIKRQTLSKPYVPELRKKGFIRTAGEGSSARQYITPAGLAHLASRETEP